MYRLKLVWADKHVTYSEFWETPNFFRVPVRLQSEPVQWEAITFKREGETQTYHEVEVSHL